MPSKKLFDKAFNAVNKEAMGFVRSNVFEECYGCKRVLVIGEHKEKCPGCGVLFKYEVTDSFWVPEGCLAVTEDEYVGEA